MPRLFTALEIPRDAALSLSLLRGGLPGARWMDVENYHMTLRFIGDIEGHVADEIAGANARADAEGRPHVAVGERTEVEFPAPKALGEQDRPRGDKSE